MTGIENNITNAIQQTESAKASDAQKNERNRSVNGLSDFVSILVQNLENTHQIEDTNKSEIETQLQALITQSPEDLTAAFTQNGQDGQNDLLAYLNSLGLETAKLPQALVNQANALTAQLAAQNSSHTASPSLLAHTHNEALTSPAPAPESTHTLSLTAQGSSASDPLFSDAARTGQTAGEAHALSFNAGDALKSFTQDGDKTQPQNAPQTSADTSSPTQKSQMLNPSARMAQPDISTQPVPTQAVSSNSLAATPSSSSLMPQGFGAENPIEMTLNSSGQYVADHQVNQDSIISQPKAAQHSQGLNSFISAKASGALHSPANQKILMTMQRNAAARIQQMTLQLEPQEMGRIEINMKFGKDGVVKAHLLVEKTDTYTMLQRDAHALENALREAGLELDDSALSFDLASRDDQFESAEKQNNSDEQFSLDMSEWENEGHSLDPLLAAQEAANQNGYIGRDHVNILI